ncbi:AfsR/SARP family transcriptional regulator [Actinomycetospora cinnamomea]|uniref:DNA-binding SARP family transcriptional activator n=1 Tax=Actinomycetospora cinnamomea TaxID=663609 RepID=A0A2U1FAY7_9PSEU|nr:BTAD domain-containing putative transcriptional regulator [Actinomycetospora cinnamomea]PVZ09353.1 DNA-binding SARP family transcriptional activator [Actinomycetospora cinnamomea]
MTVRPRFLVLGPMALRRDDGSTVVLSGRRDRLLLAVLLAAGDRSVPVETITEAVWGRPPGHNALQARVSHLRRLVGPWRLRHDHGSYRLVAAPCDRDDGVLEQAVEDAQRLLVRGEAGAALATVRGALGLVRGEPYGSASGVPSVDAAATRARDLVARARDVEIRALLESGDVEGALSASRARTIEHPTREAGWILLVASLERCGRRAEALAAYDRAVRILAERTGAGPGDELRSLRLRILAAEDGERRPTTAGPGVLEPTEMIRWLDTHGHRAAALDLAVRCAWGWWLAGDRARGRLVLLDLYGEAPRSLAGRLWACALAAHDRDEPIALAEAQRLVAARTRADKPFTGSHEGLALLLLADRRAERGEPEKARAFLEAAAPAVETTGHRWGHALADLVRGRLLLATGEPRRAREEAQRAEQVFRDQADAAGRMRALELLAALDEAGADLPNAVARYTEALRIATECGWVYGRCQLSVHLGSAVHLTGDHATGTARLAEAVALAEHLGSPSMFAWSRNNLALAQARAGDTVGAERGHRLALDWYRYAGSTAGIALTAAALARVTSAADAPALLDLADRAAAATGDPRALAYAAETQAVLAGDDDLARRHLTRARQLRVDRCGQPRPAGEQPDVDALEARLAGSRSAG